MVPGKTLFRLEELLKIVDTQADHATPDPYGEIKCTYLKLSGRVLRIKSKTILRHHKEALRSVLRKCAIGYQTNPRSSLG